MGGDNVLSRDDLFLLMEAYRNNIELSTTLLQQQNQIIDQMKITTSRQEDICSLISGVATKLDACAEGLNNTCNERVLENTKYQAKITKEHAVLGHKINLVYVGLGTLLIPLIAFLIEALDKLELIHLIADNLGVG